MPKLAAWLIGLFAVTACTLQFGVEGGPNAAMRTGVSPTSERTTPTAILTAAALAQSESTQAAGVSPAAATVTATFTPLPTGWPFTPLPTYTPLPTETPTSTPVPTVIPPDFARGPLPNGWFVFQQSVQLLPEPSPSAYGCRLIARRIDGSEEHDLTSPETFQFPDLTNCATLPAISPDGQRVAFMTGYTRNLSAGFGGPLVVMKLDGTGAVQLSASPTTPTWIVWSKDGAQIANFYYGDAKWHAFDIASGGVQTALNALTADAWYLPNVSPDGVYRASYCEPSWSTDADRICITALADDPRPLGSLDLDAGIAWTPDGGWIVYGADDGTYAVRPDGTDATLITPMGGAWWFEP